MKLKQLDPRHERFCQEYIIDLNGKEAAIRAGYSPRTAAQQASRFLTQDLIKARIAELQAKVADKLEISAERVLGELARIAFANMDDYTAWDEQGVTLKSSSGMDRDTLAAVGEVSEGKEGVKFKLHSKIDALEKLGKHLGLFKEKVEVSGPGGKPIQTQSTTVTVTEEEARAISRALDEEC